MSMSHRVSNRIAEFVETYLDETDELASFEIALMPTPEGGPMLVIFFWTPSPVLGHTSLGSIALREDPSNVTRKGLFASLNEFFAKMRAAQSKGLADVSTVPPRGSQTASGILVP